MKFMLLIMSGLCLFGCSPMLDKSHLKGGSTYTGKLNIRYNGFLRSYRLHIPTRYEPGRPMPLVVVVHGAFETAQSIEKQTGFSELADREDFIVLYPNGIGLFGWLQHWNAGHCCGKAADDDVDDVGFIAQAIEDAGRYVSIDSHRVYMVGFSNGGMLTHRFGSEHSDRLAAIAPLAASIGGRPGPDVPVWKIPAPQVPLPVIIFHGQKDTSVPYAGGIAKGKRNGREYLGVIESARFWVAHNRCASVADRAILRQGSVIRDTWSNCGDDVQVQLYSLVDWAHTWPGPVFTQSLPPDNPMHAFDAAEIIWQFFKDFRR
jgi:polyhydroxybutyrate depolymerase